MSDKAEDWLFAEPFEVLADVLLEAVVSGFVEGDFAEFFGEKALRNVALFAVVRILVAFAVAEILHGCRLR